jgi:hypothetical protein
MARIIKVYDPTETKRRFAVDIQEDHCPGLLEVMTKVPYGHEAALIRAVIYQWYTAHQQKGTLEKAMVAALTGVGGLTGNRSLKESDLESVKSLQKVPLRQPPSTPRKPSAKRKSTGTSNI